MGKADYQLREYTLNTLSTSIGASPATAYIRVPWDADLYESGVTPWSAITTANATITLAVLPQGVAASAVNVGTTLVVPLSGAAAGTSHVALHTSPNTVRAGDVIRLTPSGASGAGVVATYTLKLRR